LRFWHGRASARPFFAFYEKNRAQNLKTVKSFEETHKKTATRWQQKTCAVPWRMVEFSCSRKGRGENGQEEETEK